MAENIYKWFLYVIFQAALLILIIVNLFTGWFPRFEASVYFYLGFIYIELLQIRNQLDGMKEKKGD